MANKSYCTNKSNTKRYCVVCDNEEVINKITDVDMIDFTECAIYIYANGITYPYKNINNINLRLYKSLG